MKGYGRRDEKPLWKAIMNVKDVTYAMLHQDIFILSTFKRALNVAHAPAIQHSAIET
jgi:hypothetical protein